MGKKKSNTTGWNEGKTLKQKEQTDARRVWKGISSPSVYPEATASKEENTGARDGHALFFWLSGFAVAIFLCLPLSLSFCHPQRRVITVLSDRKCVFVQSGEMSVCLLSGVTMMHVHYCSLTWDDGSLILGIIHPDWDVILRDGIRCGTALSGRVAVLTVLGREGNLSRDHIAARLPADSLQGAEVWWRCAKWRPAQFVAEIKSLSSPSSVRAGTLVLFEEGLKIIRD